MQFCILLINSRRKEGEVGGRGRWRAKQKEYLGVCMNKVLKRRSLRKEREQSIQEE
jgi:hypothetical protein